MTKQELQRVVQGHLARAQSEIDSAAKLIDAYYADNPNARVAFHFLDKLYCPRNMHYDAAAASDGNAALEIYLGWGDGEHQEELQEEYDRLYAGQWLSSNEYRGC